MKTLITLLAFVSLSILARSESANNYSTGVIDYGIIVRDIEKSVSFYESIGLVKLTEFGVPAKITGDAGLTDYKELAVVMMSASGDEADTKIKLMQLPGKHKKQDQKYIDSTYGMSYQTLFVKDMNATVKNLEENDIAILAKGPVDLTGAGFTDVFLTLIRDPDGNIIEFVGPKL